MNKVLFLLLISMASITTIFAQKSKKNKPVQSSAVQEKIQEAVPLSSQGFLPPALSERLAPVSSYIDFSWGEGNFKDYSNTLDSLILPKTYGEIQFFLGDSVYLIKNEKPYKTKIESGAITVLDNRIFLAKGLAGTFSKKENGTIWVTFYLNREDIDSVSLPFNVKNGSNKPFVLNSKKALGGQVPGYTPMVYTDEGKKFSNGTVRFEINQGFQVPLKVEVSKGKEIIPGKDKLVISKQSSEPEIEGDVLPIMKP